MLWFNQLVDYDHDIQNKKLQQSLVSRSLTFC